MLPRAHDRLLVLEHEGFLLFRVRSAWSLFFLSCSGRRLFGVGWRPRVGRGGAGGSVIWRPTPSWPPSAGSSRNVPCWGIRSASSCRLRSATFSGDGSRSL